MKRIRTELSDGNGVPYLFSEISSDLYERPVDVDYLVQPGGHLSDVLAFSETVSELDREYYDIVILQEWGSQLLCGATVIGRQSPTCKASLDAHRVLAETAGDDRTIKILLGTYQAREQVARALLDGERWFVDTLEFNQHARVAPILLNGEFEFPEMRWRAEDGMHPGPVLSLAVALVAAEAAFGSLPGEPNSLEFLETVEKPSRQLSYEAVGTDLGIFHTDRQITIAPHVLDSLRSLPTEIRSGAD